MKLAQLTLFLTLILITLTCTDLQAKTKVDNWGANPWPEIRTQRIQKLLPQAMRAANIDAWIVICRENNNDPLADHVGGENASGTAVFLFYLDDSGFHSKVFSPIGEATALADLKIHDEVVSIARGKSAIEHASQFIQTQEFERIAVNTSATNELADGLTHSQYLKLSNALGKKISDKLLSSAELVYQWLSIKLPAEVEIIRKAAELSAQWQLEAYATIKPGITTDADVAKFLKNKMAEYGVTDGWAPDQNPNVNSGYDRGHSHATNKVIVPGDIIQTDFGIKLYGRWVSDIQRFAYVLSPDQDKPPAKIQHYWESGRDGGFAAFKAMRPGIRGEDVDAAQRILMKQNKSEYVMWSTGHPVGYVAHDVGPNLGGSHIPGQRPAAQRKLKQGMVFAFDGFHAWQLDNGKTKTISVEEMAVITEDGAEYLIPPQQELILVK